MRSAINDQAAEHESRLMQRAGGVAEGFGQRHPFGVPRAGGALEIGHHRIEHQPRLLTQHLGGGQDQLA